jgi:succinate dehydrogenase / fumarate reductase, iron-sulfur subunit
MQRMMTFVISRFNPATDNKMISQTYHLDVGGIKGKMLLDALEAIKGSLDSSLSFRRSCGEGVCGSDGMSINGQNGLACVTKLADLPNKVNIRPLPGLPVIRDLVVDMKPFFDQYEKAKPYLMSDADPVVGERLQSPEDRAKLDGLYECILCGCCTSSCPSYWWNPEKFLGPAALLAANRFIQDSRDTKKLERLEDLKDPYSAFRCRSIMSCVRACPKNLNPTKAIQEIRVEMLREEV